MAEEKPDISLIESVNLSGVWNRNVDDKVSLRLVMTLKARPSAIIPIFQLNDGLEIQITNEYVYSAAYKDFEPASSFGNHLSLGGQDVDEIQGSYPRHQENLPRRLYTSGMKLSPSPRKERLFPPSPSTTSGSDDSIFEPGHDATRRISDGSQRSKALEEGEVPIVLEYYVESDTASRRADSGQFGTSNPEHGNLWNMESNYLTPGSMVRRRYPSHQREESTTTIIHCAPKTQSRSNDRDIVDSNRSLTVALSPRKADLNIPKRGIKSRIPIKVETDFQASKSLREAHTQPRFMSELEALTSDATNLTDSEVLCNAKDIQALQVAGPRSPTFAGGSSFSSPKAIQTPGVADRERMSNSAPGKSHEERTQQLQSTPTRQVGLKNRTAVSTGKASWQKRETDLLIHIGEEPESDIFFHRGGRSDFVASWLQGRSCRNDNGVAKKDRIDRSRSGSEAPLAIDNRFDRISAWNLETTEDQSGHRSPLLVDRISLPSPTPSSKLSMPWNSAEELAGRSADSLSLMDLVNIEHIPTEVSKPAITNMNGTLSIKIPHNGMCETIIIYEADIEIQFNDSTCANSQVAQSVSPGSENGQHIAAVKWQIEYKPEWVPKLSAASGSYECKISDLCRSLNIGRVRLEIAPDRNHRECINVCRSRGDQGEMVDGEEDLKVLLNQLASYRSILSFFSLVRRSLDLRVEGMYQSAVASRFHNVTGRPKRVLRVTLSSLAIFTIGVFSVLFMNAGSHYSVGGYIGGSKEILGCLPASLECQIFRRRAKLTGAGKGLITSRITPKEAQDIYSGSERRDNPGQAQEKASTDALGSGAATVSEDLHRKQRDLGNDMTEMPTRQDLRVAEKLTTIISTSAPNATVAGQQLNTKSVEGVSHDSSLRDRIDRLLGWRGPLGH
ncbi:hypothetical protein D8B26_001683 [Coccidioides posadasii str. Silveira]|uniref:uncharacterized protein n=1 Tax=Coccidioides posadasii (strain RMSCC 757 / Silveira) TaxID=443226 RepID=UPI001BED5672|nr:hypothetical protein D8B26_001683 [Coccidioides posadasii str. Silveira]